MMADAVNFLAKSQSGDLLDTAEESLRDHIRDDVKYVIVDEYQDVNPIQERLVERLVHFGANLCVVGDDDQTIYQWRGSEVSNIITFAGRYAGVRTIELADNFRSSKGIVELGRSIAERLDSSERLPKKMLYASHQTWERGDMLTLQFADEQEEAEFIAQRIIDLRGMPFVDRPGGTPRGLSWSDCAVLFRSVKDADKLVDELKRRDIPFIIKGLARLFDAPEIQACCGLFRYMMGEISRAELAHPVGTRRNSSPTLACGQRRWACWTTVPTSVRVTAGALTTSSACTSRFSRRSTCARQQSPATEHGPNWSCTSSASSPKSSPTSKRSTSRPTRPGSTRRFAGFLTHQAPKVYEESDEDAGYVAPDAVVISTVHRSKGLQWPAVFIPYMRANRFPMKAPGGTQTIPHILPVEAVPNGARYKTNLADETRLFYVAVTRAQKYLYVTYAPGNSSMYKKASAFYLHCTASTWMSTSDEGLPAVARLTPTPRQETPNLAISFSELKYLIDCPYQFKLRFMYGFNPPIHEALGYGKGLHDALAEMHKRALAGDVPTKAETEALVDRHLHTPYAYPVLRKQLRQSAIKAIDRYFDRHGDDLTRTIHSEKQIEVQISPGVTVNGRIDLIKSLETGETAIVDFKSTERLASRERHQGPTFDLRARLRGTHRHVRRPHPDPESRRSWQEHQRPGQRGTHRRDQDEGRDGRSRHPREPLRVLTRSFGRGGI